MAAPPAPPLPMIITTTTTIFAPQLSISILYPPFYIEQRRRYDAFKLRHLDSGFEP